MRSNITAWIKKDPLTAFIVFTFVISWTAWIAIYVVPMPRLLALVLDQVGLSGPLISSVTVTGVLHGGSGVRRFLGRIFQWRVGIQWYLFVLFSAAVLAVAAGGLYVLVGGTAPALVFTVGFGSLISGIREEYGWRGFALPRLQTQYSPLKASIVIALFWVLWHLPIMPVELPMMPIYLLKVMAISILFTWVYNRTGGSMLFPVLYHAAYDMTLSGFKIPAILPLLLIYVALNWILVGIIIARRALRCGERRKAGQAGDYK